MCGIAAVVGGEPNHLRTHLERAVASLNHRGPDEQGIWINSDQCVGLAHARLSIIDLEHGQQPLIHPDGSVVAVVNGELYDYVRIRNLLEQKGHRFLTQSDSEILIGLYKEYGPDCVHHLRGEYAFILWDVNEQILLAGRDRFGIKPLFYSENDGVLRFASEAKALFSMGVKASWNPKSILYTNNMLGRGDSSYFLGVHQVPPASYLIVNRLGKRIERYWDFNYPPESEINQNVTEQEAIDTFSEVFSKAVSLRLKADVEVACYLSGGIDSCSVLQMVSEQQSHRPKAFTLSFADQQYDERSLAIEMAQHVNADLSVISVTEADLATHFEDAVAVSEMLFLNTHGIAKYLLSREVQRLGYKVVLTGEGADEILGGYPAFRQDGILYEMQGLSEQEREKAFESLRAKNLVSSGPLMSGKATDEIKAVDALLGFRPSYMVGGAQSGAFIRQLYTADFRSQVQQLDVFSECLAMPGVLEQCRGRHPIHQSMLLWSKTNLPGYVLTVLGDRMEMAHSIEGRVPFLDHELVETLVRWPVHLKIKDLQEKYLLRQAMKSKLPKSVYERPKHPFLAPPIMSSRGGALSKWVNEVVHSDALKRNPFYDQTAVMHLLKNLYQIPPAQWPAVDMVLMQVVSAVCLQERYGL